MFKFLTFCLAFFAAYVVAQDALETIVSTETSITTEKVTSTGDMWMTMDMAVTSGSTTKTEEMGMSMKMTVTTDLVSTVAEAVTKIITSLDSTTTGTGNTTLGSATTNSTSTFSSSVKSSSSKNDGMSKQYAGPALLGLAAIALL